MKKWLLVVVALVVAGGAALLLTDRQEAPKAVFTLLSGEKLPLDSLRGKVVLVDFWATSCPGCVKEMPQLVETHNKYQGQGFETVAVAMSYDPPEYVKAFAAKNGLPFKVALDADGGNAKAFGDVRLTPTSFLIDRQGHVVQRILGEPDFVKLHQLIEQKLAQAS
jgi:peroxiredoxin